MHKVLGKRLIKVTIPLPKKWYHKFFGIEPGALVHFIPIYPDTYDKAEYTHMIVLSNKPFILFEIDSSDGDN